jgi:hypothetical protein
MILPLTLPHKPSPNSPVLPPIFAHLGSSELFLLELQGDLEVSGDKHGQLVGRLTIDEDGKVRARSQSPRLHALHVRSGALALTCVNRAGKTNVADRPPPLGGKDNQLAQAARHITARGCVITKPASARWGRGLGRGCRHARIQQ